MIISVWKHLALNLETCKMSFTRSFILYSQNRLWGSLSWKSEINITLSSFKCTSAFWFFKDKLTQLSLCACITLFVQSRKDHKKCWVALLILLTDCGSIVIMMLRCHWSGRRGKHSEQGLKILNCFQTEIMIFK